VNRAHGAEQNDSDWSLLARVVERDESALAALYDRYSGLVYAESLRILRDSGAAEEILQDLFHQVWRTAEKFDPARGSLPGWLLVAARNRSISRLRRRGYRDSEELNENSVVLPCGLETTVARNQLLGRVKAVLSGLADGQREAIELAYFEGMTHSEIAEHLGAPLGTIKTRIRSALETLKQALA